MKRDATPLGCFGNKRNELNTIEQYFSQIADSIETVIDPFCGSAIVSKSLYDLYPHVKVHINDLDHHRIAFYKNAADPEWCERWMAFEREVLDAGKEKYMEICAADTFEKYVLSKRIHKFRNGVFPKDPTRFYNKPIGTPAWLKFFKHAVITNEEWLDAVAPYKHDPKAFVFLDPPYFKSDNRAYENYSKKFVDDSKTIYDGTQLFIDLLHFMEECECKFMMVINDNAILRHIYAKFIKESYGKTYSASLGKTQHLVLTNF